jgi:hypothetical protein
MLDGLKPTCIVLPRFQLALVIDLLLLLHDFHYHWNRQCHIYGNLGRDGIKVFQIGEYATSAGLLGIRLMFSFKNIVAPTTLGVRDDRLDAMTSFISPILHLDSS